MLPTDSLVPLSALFALLFAGTSGLDSKSATRSPGAPDAPPDAPDSRSTRSGASQGSTGSEAAIPEPPKPRPEHRQLLKLVGRWDATVTTLDPEHSDRGPQTSPATCIYKSIGDMWVACEFQGKMGGKSFVGHGVEGFDTHKGKFVSLWTDSWSTEFMTFEGDADPATHTITMTGRGRDARTGEIQHLRTTTEMQGDDVMVFRMFRTDAPEADAPRASGARDVEMMRIEYRRRH